MKKSITKSIVFITILVLIISLSACGSDKKGDSSLENNTTVESSKDGVRAGTLKPGDKVPDGDKAKPGTDNTLYGGAVVGDTEENNTKTKGVE